MARITVEDCITHIPNHFDLVVAASRRSRDIASGMPTMLKTEKDKNSVMALREIGDNLISKENLFLRIVQQLQQVIEHDNTRDYDQEYVDQYSKPEDAPVAAEAEASQTQNLDDPMAKAMAKLGDNKNVFTDEENEE